MELSTTILIIAPHEVQQIAVPILRQHWPEALNEIPAHITLLYPFVPFERLPTGCATVREICAGVAPFEITMEGYDHFPGIAFMKPVNPEPIEALFRKIYAAFPECPPYEGQFGEDLHPHMTVAHFPDEAAQKNTSLPDYEPITFRVERVHVAYGIPHSALPWLPYDVIPLGGR